ncbi:MAG TPA: MarR family winged helix-turn-helix transcriptional regulator [Steroidobacteraceae bacterium]|jgi:DNA-binding MarR family transcriptional regulator
MSGAVHEGNFKFSEWPFYWLTRVADRYVQQLEVALKAIGLDIPGWRVLMQIQGNLRPRVTELAEHAIIKLPTMTKILQRMEAEGLIVSLVSKSDARVTEIMLTPEGRIARRKAWAEADRIYRYAFSDMKDEKIASLTAMLNQLFENLGSQPAASTKGATTSKRTAAQ